MALGPIIIPIMYLIGLKLPQPVIESDEYNYLFEVVNLYGRYLNDVNGYQREREQGKFINSIRLRLIHGRGEESEEEIIKKIQNEIEEKRKELLRIVLKKEGSKVARKLTLNPLPSRRWFAVSVCSSSFLFLPPPTRVPLVCASSSANEDDE
ncbi:ent-kaur-16-ene synthase, chloroplastic-like [Neltuma alba]|uniref:ent-kaur-16-ene synthase, chloroplastic-like n=1 Tax=Neltuma alba TaxID=207710 RepID=UPI0010A3BCAD|nr:ent-kaur-16-ene synthase, chloroplastic-like [Prosopis alba]